MIQIKYLLVTSILLASGLLYAASDEAALQAFTEESRTMSEQFLQQLEATRQAEIETIGSAYAIEVCASTGPSLAVEMSRNLDISIKRVSLRPRNIVRGGGDAWEQQALFQFRDEMRNGKPVTKSEYAGITEEPMGTFLRYIRPIMIKEKCIQCHGQKPLSPEISNIIMRLYPHDRATGYKVGDLVGAISLKKQIR